MKPSSKKPISIPTARPRESHAKEPTSMPNGRFLLESVGLSQERLAVGIKVGIPTQLLKELLRIAASTLPFESDYYLATYPDIREAHDAGRIADPRIHFIETGYMEGRFGSKPIVDEKYYRNAYPDVEAAIAAGNVSSALEHYMRGGAFEGRVPSSESVSGIKRWLAILGQ